MAAEITFEEMNDLLTGYPDLKAINDEVIVVEKQLTKEGAISEPRPLTSEIRRRFDVIWDLLPPKTPEEAAVDISARQYFARCYLILIE